MVIEIIILDLIIPGTGLLVGRFALFCCFGGFRVFCWFVFGFWFAFYHLLNISLSSTKNPDTCHYLDQLCIVYTEHFNICLPLIF